MKWQDFPYQQLSIGISIIAMISPNTLTFFQYNASWGKGGEADAFKNMLTKVYI